jgi:hypothetical protein
VLASKKLRLDPLFPHRLPLSLNIFDRIFTSRLQNRKDMASENRRWTDPYSFRGGGDTTFRAAAPIATSGDNIYIAWWTNKTGNNEVMFRASTDNGATFGDKINLSNSTNAESVNASIAAEGDHVYVSWWERNATSNEPLLRVSNDNGKTFGEIIRLSSNATTGSDGR